MRYLGLSTLVMAALLANGCGKTEGDDTGPGRPNGGATGQMTRGSGGNSAPAGGVFGNPSGMPTGAGGTHIANPDDVTCAKSHITATRVVPTVLLLLDGSSSMENCYGADTNLAIADGGMGAVCVDPPGFPPPPLPAGTITRWEAIRRAVTDPMNGVVARLQDRVMFGVAVFGTVNTCPLPLGVVPPSLNNYNAIAGNVPQLPPGLTTPTGVALDMIVDMLPDPVNGALDMTIGPQIVVLATDGDPNSCDGGAALGMMADYGPSIAAATKLAAKNQRMYVISVGDEAGKAHLQEMANIGSGMPAQMSPGAPVYYPEDPAALADTLATLIGAELSCDLALEGKGVVESMACTGTVELNGQRLECDGADGWKLKDKTHITLQGKACETFKMGADALLDAEFPCEALIVD